MPIKIHSNSASTGRAAATRAATLINQIIAQQNSCRLVFATGASQFELLAQLTAMPLPWSKITGFHLDEYLGLAPDHPASFCHYLQERVVSKVPLQTFHFINGLTESPERECERLSQAISTAPIDLALIGIGENGHLAFNDPPADFESTSPYIVVELDEACRRQQLGEGWFPTLEAVPRQAISMSIQQILAARHLICTVPDARKAVAVAAAIEGPETPLVPASILRRHPALDLFLDLDSASLLQHSAHHEDRR
ncbi:MAG: glucosamine-6-phosphate deaminase [Planctomycetota bacterium]